jgi:hypothetical protein
MTNAGSRDVVREGVHCRLAIDRPATGIVVVKLSGWDAGEFGDLPMRELARDLVADRPIELFIDARDVKGASIEVSGEWARWLATNRAHFQHISMLTGSRFVQLTANFVRRFAELGDIMRIYTDPAAFDLALLESIHYPARSPLDPDQ